MKHHNYEPHWSWEELDCVDVRHTKYWTPTLEMVFQFRLPCGSDTGSTNLGKHHVT